MSALQPFAPDVWTADGPAVGFFGFAYPTRMAVIRLADGGLFVWSPVALTAALQSETAALGPVRHLVSPNRLHHLYLGAWVRAFPAARLWASPGLARKRRDLIFTGTLGDTPPPDWRGEVDQLLFAGSIALSEIVFFHRASRTALVCDLIQHFPRGWFTGWRGWVARLDGIVAPDWGPPREWRASFLDRASARRSLARLKGWQAERLVTAHAPPVTADAAAVIGHAFRWLN